MVKEAEVDGVRSHLLESAVDCPQNEKKFYCGVVEGFYGRPWTTDQRKELFKRMQAFGIDTYLYAPKDDCKHRMYWRDLYSVEEADHLTGLVDSAAEYNITFVYALSPGLDISYSNSKEVTCLKRKLEQVSTFGCKAFALLFDDIDVDMNEADKALFQSFAQAQVSVTNEVYQYLHQPEKFLFCPTEYCSTRAVPTVCQSDYLTTIGSRLLPDIDIMWTGPKVISKVLTIEHIAEISKVLCRPPVIWDNIHANDYDQKRLFLGPYEGRSTSLIPHLRGVMTNPNCEFEANYIPIHTLAQWAKSNPSSAKCDPLLSCSPVSADIKLEREGELTDDILPGSYHPKDALHNAIQDWMIEFRKECNAPSRKIASVAAPAIAPPTSPIPVPGVLATSTPLLSGLNAINGLNAVEVNESYMQPVAGAPVNSLIDPSSDSDVDSAIEHLEPMDCVISGSIVQEKSVAAGYDSGCADCENSMTGKTEKMQVDLDTVFSGAGDNLATLLPQCNSCVDSVLVYADKVCCEDIQLLVDLFYMPFEHGKISVDLLNEFLWLKVNCSSAISSKCENATIEQKEKDAEWKERVQHFREQLKAIFATLDKFLEVPNKAILQDLHQYIWDVKTILTIVDAFISWLAMGHVPVVSLYYMQGNPYTWASIYYQDAFRSGDQEPWVFRGGLQAEFQRLLPLDGVADLLLPTIPPSFSTKMLVVRPYTPADKTSVYEICRKTSDDGSDATEIFPGHLDLMGDKRVGRFLEICPEYCFVLEDTNGKVVGYSAACLDIADFNRKVESVWIPNLKEKYPKSQTENGLTPAEEMMNSFYNYQPYCPDDLYSRFPSMVRLDVLPECQDDPTAYKRVLASVVVALKTNGSHGMFTEMNIGDQNVMDAYSRLMFHNIPLTDLPEGMLIVGRVI